jgi:chromosome segregation ATPase
MASELERIKILEGKVSQIVDYINKLIRENGQLKNQIKDLRAAKKELEEQARKFKNYDSILQNYKQEKEEMKEKIETIISQIDQIGL